MHNGKDNHTRDALWIETTTSVPDARVTQALEMLVPWRGTPPQPRFDDEPEFFSRG